jgi:hypothetical protein
VTDPGVDAESMDGHAQREFDLGLGRERTLLGKKLEDPPLDVFVPGLVRSPNDLCGFSYVQRSSLHLTWMRFLEWKSIAKCPPSQSSPIHQKPLSMRSM